MGLLSLFGSVLKLAWIRPFGKYAKYVTFLLTTFPSDVSAWWVSVRVLSTLVLPSVVHVFSS